MDLILGCLGVNVFSVDDLLDGGCKSSLDVCVGELCISGRVSNGLLTQIIEGDDNLKHTNSLVKRTSVIVLSESILSKEILTNKFGNFHHNLLILRKRFLTNKLDNLGKVIFLLKDGTALVTEVRVLFVHAIEVRLEDLHVLGVRDKPVKTGEMLTLGKLLIKTPEHLHNRKSSSSNGIGEITTGRRHGTHNGNGTLTFGGTKT
mmetsp:Transcript_23161/g.27874  ORF Transcript_23161/g.27874 Transcript_23161/m.27874 type:complete len:204 (+) Transcript_23161:239-850(+)